MNENKSILVNNLIDYVGEKARLTIANEEMNLNIYINVEILNLTFFTYNISFNQYETRKHGIDFNFRYDEISKIEVNKTFIVINLKNKTTFIIEQIK
jgi:uncharacterized ubiquitin-like protein YukD